MGETVMNSSYLEWLQKDFEGSPFWNHMGIEVDHLEVGNVSIKMPVKPELLNSNGVMHGGAIATILDSVIGAAIRTEREVRVATISLTTNFVAPVREGTVYATARIINPGKRILYVESTATVDKEEIVGTALGTFTILKK